MDVFNNADRISSDLEPEAMYDSNTTELNVTEPNNPESEIYNLIGSAVLFFGCVLTILFNSSLLFCILKNRRKPWVRNANQIIYLILCDFLVGILLLPRTGTIFARTSQMPYSSCALFSYILVTTQSLSYYHILAVCIHRYRMARRIHLQFAVDKYRYGRESLIIWVSVMVIFVPPYFIWGRHGEILFKCRFENVFGPSDIGAKLYLLVLFSLPWITTNVLYIIILHTVRNSLKRVHAVNNDSTLHVSTNRTTSPTHDINNESTFPTNRMTSAPYNVIATKKVLCTVGYLLLVFNASCVVTISIVLGMLFDTVIPHIIQPLVLANNICNPFIYASANTTLKQETKKVLLEIIDTFRCNLPCMSNSSTSTG